MNNNSAFNSSVFGDNTPPESFCSWDIELLHDNDIETDLHLPYIRITCLEKDGDDVDKSQYTMEYEDVRQYVHMETMTFVWDPNGFPEQPGIFVPQDLEHPFFSELEKACKKYFSHCDVFVDKILENCGWALSENYVVLVNLNELRNDEEQFNLNTEIIYNAEITKTLGTLIRFNEEKLELPRYTCPTLTQQQRQDIITHLNNFYQVMFGLEFVSNNPYERLEFYLESVRGRALIKSWFYPIQYSAIELKLLRLSLHLSIEECANFIGHSEKQYQSMESGVMDVDNASMEKLLNINHLISRKINDVAFLYDEHYDLGYDTIDSIVLVTYSRKEDLDDLQEDVSFGLPIPSLHGKAMTELKKCIEDDFQIPVRIVEFNAEKYQFWERKRNSHDANLLSFYLPETPHVLWAKETLVQ